MITFSNERGPLHSQNSFRILHPHKNLVPYLPVQKTERHYANEIYRCTVHQAEQSSKRLQLVNIRQYLRWESRHLHLLPEWQSIEWWIFMRPCLTLLTNCSSVYRPKKICNTTGLRHLHRTVKSLCLTQREQALRWLHRCRMIFSLTSGTNFKLVPQIKTAFRHGGEHPDVSGFEVRHSSLTLKSTIVKITCVRTLLWQIALSIEL